MGMFIVAFFLPIIKYLAVIFLDAPYPGYRGAWVENLFFMLLFLVPLIIICAFIGVIIWVLIKWIRGKSRKKNNCD